MTLNLITSQISPLPALAALEGMWRSLESRCEGSFFTTWNFIGPILALTSRPPQVFIARQQGASGNDAVVGLALIARTSRPSPVGSFAGLTLNQTGAAQEDRVYIEFNDILCPQTLRASVLEALEQSLEALDPAWAELHLAGFAEPQLAAFVEAFGLAEAPRKTSPAPFVDLERVREEGYLSLLGRNTRSQIRRARRLFEEKFGPITLRIVQDAAEIQAGITQLAAWQTERFGGTKTPSAFESAFFGNFIEATLKQGATQDTCAELLEIKAGDQPLGLLVTFCHRGVAANYQCAFPAFPGDNRLKPGLVAHAEAIEHYSREGHRVYHFLGGDQQYKKSLSTDVDQMVWTRLQKPGLRANLEASLLATKSHLKARLRRPS
jgi:CelD/BcsL family acetyltransferase involved in cellulose biosynthesis